MPMTEENDIDVRALTRWLGVDGARAGIEACRALTIDVLRSVAEKAGYSISSKSATRSQVIDELLKFANRRIDRPLASLVKMSEEEIVDYLEKANPGREELLELLREIKVAPTREGQKSLIRYAARELSETGRFIAIASAGTQLTLDDKVALRDGHKRTQDK
jgi:hypothetical protein